MRKTVCWLIAIAFTILLIQIVFVFLLPFISDKYENHYFVTLTPWIALILSSTLCVILFFVFSMIKLSANYHFEEKKRQEERTYKIFKDIDEKIRMESVLEFRQEMERFDKERIFLKEIVNSLKTEKGQEIISNEQSSVVSDFLNKYRIFPANTNKT